MAELFGDSHPGVALLWMFRDLIPLSSRVLVLGDPEGESAHALVHMLNMHHPPTVGHQVELGDRLGFVTSPNFMAADPHMAPEWRSGQLSWLGEEGSRGVSDFDLSIIFEYPSLEKTPGLSPGQRLILFHSSRSAPLIDVKRSVENHFTGGFVSFGRYSAVLTEVQEVSQSWSFGSVSAAVRFAEGVVNLMGRPCLGPHDRLAFKLGVGSEERSHSMSLLPLGCERRLMDSGLRRGYL